MSAQEDFRGALESTYETAEMIDATLQAHSAWCPALRHWRALQKARPLPFDTESIPRDTVVAIAEQMSGQGLTLYQAAEDYGYPAELLQLELAKLMGEYRRELQRRSAWRPYRVRRVGL